MSLSDEDLNRVLTERGLTPAERRAVQTIITNIPGYEGAVPVERFPLRVRLAVLEIVEITNKPPLPPTKTSI